MDSPDLPDTDIPRYTHSARRTPRFKNYAGQADPHDPLKHDPTYEDISEASTENEDPCPRNKPRQRNRKDAIPKRPHPAKKIPDSRYQSAPIQDDDEPIRGGTPYPRSILDHPQPFEANQAEANARQNEPVHMQNQRPNNNLPRRQLAANNPRRRPSRGPDQAPQARQADDAEDASVKSQSRCVVM
ncbi:hypothetical protein PMIN06_007350 [Paraphaeosphaeria minitans]|uniref:Uncharacterized protein n=1 Tax=Paraphaeosphaeria minitans TaxID=565426 RepID=A0A9P6KTL8_9PLEO|nr:hypothetical protein PMIN01_03740 [Paraphaeosphaeria minitans]